MIEEIEVQLKGTIRVMNRRRGEATGGNVQRNVPPVVQPGSESEADLAYDLRPHMKRGTGVFPRSIWERQIVGKVRSEEHTSELQSQSNLVCRLLLEKKKNKTHHANPAPESSRGVSPQTATPELPGSDTFTSTAIYGAHRS